MLNPNRVIGKACAKCGGVERYKIHGACCACTTANGKAWDLAHPEARRALSRRYNAKHPDTRREWAKANPEKVRAKSKKWALLHPEKQRARHMAWSKKNIGRASELTRAWQRAHPDEAKALTAKRIARLKGAAIGCRKEYTAFLKWVRTTPIIPCFYCKRDTSPKERHRDHYIPLARGGSDSVENLRVACAECNQKKCALMPDEFMRRLA